MTRILTAAVLIPVVLVGIFGGSWWTLFAVIAAISALSYVEYCQILQLPLQLHILGLLAGLGLLGVPSDLIPIGLALFVLLAMAITLGTEDLRAAFRHSAAMLLGVLYVFGGMRAAYLLGLTTPWWLLFALVINWIGDSGAYYVGRAIGTHKMAPRISPGKSWEGAAASIVFSTVFFVLVVPRFLPVSMPIAALLALAGNVAGQIGDLAESALKRGAGVKDSSTLLPGHGGMLDRVDSVLFTLPVIYSLMIWLKL